MHDIVSNCITVSDCKTILILHIFHTFAYFTVRLSETISPAIYMYGSRDLRVGLKRMRQCCIPKKTQPRNTIGVCLLNKATASQPTTTKTEI